MFNKCQMVKFSFDKQVLHILILNIKINEKFGFGKGVGNDSFLLRVFIFREKITGLAVLQLQV